MKERFNWLCSVTGSKKKTTGHELGVACSALGNGEKTLGSW